MLYWRELYPIAPVFDSLGIWRPIRVVRATHAVRKVSLMMAYER